MPYRPTTPDHYLLWPHRSLSRHGFVWFIGLTSALLLLPLLTQLGRLALWALLPFLLGAVAAIWVALRRSYRTDSEELSLTRDEIRITRHSPGKADRVWAANPYWVRPALLPSGGPVPDYLTLTGNGRSVELGAFLTQRERRDLYALICTRLAEARALTPSAT